MGGPYDTGYNQPMRKHHAMTRCRRLTRACAVVIFVNFAFDAAAVQSAVPGLLSHRAVYSLSQHLGSTSSDIAAIKGRLEITFEVACDGWRIEQYIGFRLYHIEGTGLEHVARLSGWESTDGADYWFNTRSYQDRELLEEIGGVARLDGNGGSGETRLAKPVKEVRPLPAGTIFPARHLSELIAAAINGERHLTRTVFDGSTLDSPYEITAFIGPERAPGGKDAPTSVSTERSWPFRLAYFKPSAVQPSPEFELSAILYANGVAGDMIYDYGDYAIDVELRELEALPKQECG